MQEEREKERGKTEREVGREEEREREDKERGREGRRKGEGRQRGKKNGRKGGSGRCSRSIVIIMLQCHMCDHANPQSAGSHTHTHTHTHTQFNVHHT